MPGFDKSRFFGLRESDEELMCGICLAIINQPVVTPCCSQMFCGDCMRQWLQSKNICPNDRIVLNASNLLEPQRSVKNMLEKLEIMCDFYDKGCDKRIALGRLKSHIKTCRYNPEAICDVCNEKNGEIRTHDCNHNFLAKIKILVKRNEELNKKQNKCVENNKKLSEELKESRKYITEIEDLNTKLNEENKTLKSNMFVMNNKIKTVIDFNAKSLKQFEKSIKQSSVLKDEFISLQQSLNEDINSDYHLDSVVNHCIQSTSSTHHDKSLLKSSFQYKVENVISLQNIEFVFSPWNMFYGFKWRIIAEYLTENNIEYLAYFIKCNSCDVSTDWCFEASVQLKVINQSNGKSMQRDMKQIFCTKESDLGFNKFMTWWSIFDPKEGFLKDDAIILEVVITPETQLKTD